jgi:hypothetical protein
MMVLGYVEKSHKADWQICQRQRIHYPCDCEDPGSRARMVFRGHFYCQLRIREISRHRSRIGRWDGHHGRAQLPMHC